MGPGQVQVRQHRQGCARKTSVRLVLHQERFDWSRSAHRVPDGQDRFIAPGCPVMSAIMSAIVMKMKIVFWLAAALVGYSYLGYPAWLWLRCRWSPRPVRRGLVDGSTAPAVTAVMVGRNEEAIVARKPGQLLNPASPPETPVGGVPPAFPRPPPPAFLAVYPRVSGWRPGARPGAAPRVRAVAK